MAYGTFSFAGKKESSRRAGLAALVLAAAAGGLMYVSSPGLAKTAAGLLYQQEGFGSDFDTIVNTGNATISGDEDMHIENYVNEGNLVFGAPTGPSGVTEEREDTNTPDQKNGEEVPFHDIGPDFKLWKGDAAGTPTGGIVFGGDSGPAIREMTPAETAKAQEQLAGSKSMLEQSKQELAKDQQMLQDSQQMLQDSQNMLAKY